MRGEGEEVAAERLHVDRPVRRRLGGVDDHDRVPAVRPGRESLERIDRPERVGDEVRGDDAHVPVTGRAVEVAEVELALVVERDHPEVGAGPLRDVLPGDEVRVVLELGHEDDVSGPEVDEPPGVGDEVQPLGRVPREDELLRRRRVDERRELLAGALVTRGRALAELVDAAVHVGVRGLVEGPQRVEDLPRLLSRRGRVEIRERLAVELLLEDRKVGANLSRVELGRARHGHVSYRTAAP